MKAAAYIDDKCDQLVLIPENEFETMLLNRFQEKSLLGQMAGVYECRGGYSRFTPPGYNGNDCLVLTATEQDDTWTHPKEEHSSTMGVGQ